MVNIQPTRSKISNKASELAMLLKDGPQGSGRGGVLTGSRRASTWSPAALGG
jgi:hypothetical protein